jgi:hypothetical protein
LPRTTVPATGHWPLATGHCKIIALTAGAFAGCDQIIEAGCDDVVTKPYHEATIFEAMATHLGARFIFEAVATPGGAPEPDGRAIVIANRMRAVPHEIILDLSHSVTRGDVAEVMRAVERVREIDGPLADEIERLVRGYHFDEIQRAAEPLLINAECGMRNAE